MVCEGRMMNGPKKRYVRCVECGRVDYEKNEGDPCIAESSEHPDRKLPDVHKVAAMLYGMAWQDWQSRRDEFGYADRQAAAARDAYMHADALLAEAKRRRGE